MKFLRMLFGAVFMFLLPTSMVVDRGAANRQCTGASGIPALSFAQEKPPALNRITKETTVVPKIGTFKSGTLTVSPDGRHFAYARKEGKRWVVELDGKAEGTYQDVALVNGPAGGLTESDGSASVHRNGVEWTRTKADSRRRMLIVETRVLVQRPMGRFRCCFLQLRMGSIGCRFAPLHARGSWVRLLIRYYI